MKIRTLFFTLFLSSNLQAEYRVYQYLVKSAYLEIRGGDGHLVTSTLDPVTYKAYHGGQDSLVVELLRTWTCKGHTGNFQRPCLSPLGEYSKTMAGAKK